MWVAPWVIDFENNGQFYTIIKNVDTNFLFSGERYRTSLIYKTTAQLQQINR
jgi:hypothetical protein